MGRHRVIGIATVVVLTTIGLGSASQVASAIGPIALPPGAGIISTDVVGRFVVVGASDGTKYRFDRLNLTTTTLPALLALSDDGWFGITLDFKWLDIATSRSIAVPHATTYDLSGDGQTVVGRDDTTTPSTYWVLSIALRSQQSLPIPGDVRAISSNGQFVLLGSCSSSGSATACADGTAPPAPSSAPQESPRM
jgi:hypothetical protein